MSALAYREMYCPAHFGNTYEVASEAEMREILTEAREWGFNAYGDWFDGADLKNPLNNPRGHHLLPQDLFERKLRSFRVAQDVGLQTSLLVTPNHVYLDQLAPELLADTGISRYFGQLLCPSQPAAREIILANHRDIFEMLQRWGVKLGSISGCPFDYGGCDCDKCRPWIVTFGRLYAEIVEMARDYFPDITARLVGWWWEPEEHELFADWADAEAPGLFRSMALHILYGATAPAQPVRLPQGCEAHAFVHIGYPDDASAPRDVYGIWGAVAAPVRLEATARDLREFGCTGFTAYCEGFYHDVNTALWGGLASERWSSSGEVLSDYARRYFDADEDQAGEWARWLAQWGAPRQVDTARAREDFERLVAALPEGASRNGDRLLPAINVRLAQWESKLRLFEIEARILAGEGWDEERIALGHRFFAELEWMQRKLWGYGPIRHALNPYFQRPTWYRAWREAAGVVELADMADQDDEA
jgi:hypothetical protein